MYAIIHFISLFPRWFLPPLFFPHLASSIKVLLVSTSPLSSSMLTHSITAPPKLLITFQYLSCTYIPHNYYWPASTPLARPQAFDQGYWTGRSTQKRPSRKLTKSKPSTPQYLPDPPYPLYPPLPPYPPIPPYSPYSPYIYPYNHYSHYTDPSWLATPTWTPTGTVYTPSTVYTPLPTPAPVNPLPYCHCAGPSCWCAYRHWAGGCFSGDEW